MDISSPDQASHTCFSRLVEKTEKQQFLSAALTKFVTPRATNGIAPPDPNEKEAKRVDSN
jgi:hypothetical protein